jgi:hypothetical protein
MEMTEDKTGVLESLIERAEAYGKTTFDLLKLKSVDKTANVVSSAVSRIVACVLLLMFLGIASIGVALWLGEIMGKVYYGFFCVAGFYGICGLVLYLARDNFIRKSVNDSIIESALN